MSQDDAYNLYLQGVIAIKNGDKREARKLLVQSVQLDTHNEYAWLWLAGVAGSMKETETCLKWVLSINPENKWAQKGLAKIQEKQRDPSRSAPPVPQWKCPLDFTGSVRQIEQCARCKVVRNFSIAEALLNAPELNCAQIFDIAARYQGEHVGDDELKKHASLALIYLNLHQPANAAPHLEALERANPDDPLIASNIHALLDGVHKLIQPPEPEVIPQESKGTIMVVDDSATVRKLVTIVLQKDNFDVISAADGMEALTVLSEHIPDLILLDITMPRIDGYTLCRLIRSDEKTKSIPVVMLSGKDGFFDKVRGKMSGSTDFISKPFDPETFAQTISKYLNLPKPANAMDGEK